MSGFYNKGVDIIQSVVGSPVGSISAYLGTTDPSGWVICDGKGRIDDASHNTYGKLFNMGIGNYSSDTDQQTYVVTVYYSPPDLRGRFLYSSKNSLTMNASGGSETVTLTINNLPSHDHRTQSEGYGTRCFAIQSGNADGSKVQATVSLGALNYLNGWNGNGVGDTTYTTNNSVLDPFTRQPIGGIPGNAYISVSSDLRSISTNYTGLGQSIKILPPYIEVNYIIKY